MKKINSNFKFSVLGIIIIFLLLPGRQSISQTIVYPTNGSDMELLAAKEVRRYIYLRTDQNLLLQSETSLPGNGDLILVAKDNNPMVESLRGLLNHTTAMGGIIIKTVSEGGRNILVITGNTDAATLHAAYRYAEHLGVFFDLAEDVIPDAKISLDITGYDEAGIPNFETNGIQPYHDFPSGPDLWSTEDYLHFISQLPKMGMNFIGVHTYTRYNSLWDKDNGHNRGPEPSVWIGLEEDFNASTGEVNWSYPAYYAHSQRPNWIWGFDTYNTGDYHAGAKDLFPTNGWGSDVIGQNPPQDGDIAACNAVFNRTGEMFNTAFTHAQNIGVKTALGTELPLGVENDSYDSWVRGIPQELQTRLTGMGKSPTDPNTVKDLYKGIFKRIMATHPLDYYWLWSYEIWPGDNSTWVQSFENDITLAIQALNELGNPFQIAHAGWQLGTNTNPAELENVFPSEAPFFSLMGSATGYDQLSTNRVKWPSTWLEYDRSLGQPELAVDRVHEDAYASLGINAQGFITESWRTRIMSPNIGAMRELSWTYGPTGTPLTKTVPTWPGSFVNNFYVSWATKMFGPEAASGIASIFQTLEYDMPHPVEWAEEQTGTYYMVPGAILANSTNWSSEESRYSFVTNFENLRPQIVGAGNLERFDYWLKSWQALKLKGQYGCERHQFEDAMSKSNWTDALNHRITLASLWEQIMKLEVEKATNVSDLGDIMNLEVVNWKQLMMNKHDAALEAGLGYTLPANANPSQSYSGSSFIKVLAPRTQVNEVEALKLKAIAMGVSNPSLKYRTLGATSWNTISLTNVGRSVYEVTIPAQTNDYEYYIESGSVKYPVSANSAAPTYNTVVITGSCSATVPDVVGQSQAAAESAISAANLVSSASTLESETVPAGEVISQNPTSGSVPCQSTVYIVVSSGPPSNCIQISSSDFESGWQGWTDGGTDCRRSSQDAAYANSGTYCIRLVDNTSTSVVTSPSLDASGYGSLEVAFSYLCRSMDNANEDFWLQVSTDGSTFTTVEEWNQGDEFVNDQRYNETVTINGVFSSTTQIRFRCDASGNSDYVYIDDVVIQGCDATPCTATVPDVVGQAQATAEANIVAANLTVGTVTTQSSETVAAGNVISQNPVSGLSVSCSSSVDIVVSTGPASQTWPGWYFIENKFHTYPRLQDDGTTTPKVVATSDNSDACRWQFIDEGSGLFYIQNSSGMRLSDGNGTDNPLLVANTVTTDRVKWSVVESSTAGEYWITSNAANSQPRIRTDNTTIPDMQGTGSTGNWTKWEIVSTTDPGTSPTQYTLITNATIGGSVTAGGTYDEGTVVSITATPDAGYQFDNWSGDASGSTNPLDVTIDANKSVTANFSSLQGTWNKVDSHDPSVTVSGSGYDSYTNSDFAYMNTWYAVWNGTVSFTFTGTKVRLYAVKSIDFGSASIKIDGATVGSTPNLNSSEEIGDFLAFESADLSSGSHTIEVVNGGEFGVDAFEYFGAGTKSANAISSVSLKDEKSTDLLIYPNPVNDNIYLLSRGINGQVEVIILNQNGSKVFSNKYEILDGISIKIPVTNLDEGLYILHVTNEEFKKIERFVIIK